MGKNIKNEYQKHIRDTAPDMERLWERIDSEIDKTENAENKKSYENIRITTSRRNWSGVAAAAAAVLVIAVGASVYRNGSIVEKDNKSGASTGNDNSVTVPVQQDEAISETVSGEQEAPAEEKNVRSDTNDIEMTDDFDGAVSYNEERNATAEQSLDGKTAELADAPRASVKYETLALADTDTAAYSASYTAGGDEFFVEDKVLAETDVFADVTVERAELTPEGGRYTLLVSSAYSRDGTQLDGELTITSTTPYILQENREYLIPLREDNGTWYIVFENAPQIEMTLDGGAVFQNGWSIESSADVQRDELGQNDFYYDRLCYCGELELRSFISGFVDT